MAGPKGFRKPVEIGRIDAPEAAGGINEDAVNNHWSVINAVGLSQKLRNVVQVKVEGSAIVFEAKPDTSRSRGKNDAAGE